MHLNRRSWAHACVASLLAMGFFGCVGEPEVLPITPDYPTLGNPRRTRPWLSSLVVSTETWVDFNLGTGEGTLSRPTGYTLYDEQGIKIRYVRNYIGATDTEPTTLDLEPGRYLVRPDKPYRMPPVFWVVVEPGKVTEVNLRK